MFAEWGSIQVVTWGGGGVCGGSCCNTEQSLTGSLESDTTQERSQNTD